MPAVFADGALPELTPQVSLIVQYGSIVATYVTFQSIPESQKFLIIKKESLKMSNYIIF